MIPVLGITVSAVNINIFKSLIQSINYSIENVSLLCNNSDFDYFLNIKSLCTNKYVKKFTISYCPYNLGCAGGWNYHIKNNSTADYWILSNDDIIYGENDLKNFDESSRIYDITFNKFNKSSGGKYSFFSLSKNCVEKVGIFDENIYPVYFEDDDYDARIKKHILSINYLGIDAIHMHEGTIKNLNQKDAEYVKNFLWKKNEEYYKSKILKNDFSEGRFSLEERRQKIFRIKNNDI